MSFYGFPYPTRMAVAKLSDGSAWAWSPVALSDELAGAVEGIGPVRHIVSPNKIHHLFLREWAERWPDARVYAPPGLAQRKPELRFDAELQDAPEPAWAEDIDQVIFRGSLAMEEVVFFHRESSTAIVCDLPGDVDADGDVDIDDFLDLLAAWGSCPQPCPPSCAADFNGDCSVGIDDFLALLANWTG